MIILKIFAAIMMSASAGIYVGNGGGGVVCYDNAIPESLIRASPGDYQPKTAEPREYFFTKLNSPKEALIHQIQKLSYADGVEVLHQALRSQPEFYEKIRKANQALGMISNGSFLNSPLKYVPDGLDIFDPGDHCLILQIVNCFADQVFVNESVWKVMTGVQKAVMQLHEEIYYVARAGQSDPGAKSESTSLLLNSMLSSAHWTEDYPEKLKRYGF